MAATTSSFVVSFVSPGITGTPSLAEKSLIASIIYSF
jgi:hypothetical protein